MLCICIVSLYQINNSEADEYEKKSKKQTQEMFKKFVVNYNLKKTIFSFFWRHFTCYEFDRTFDFYLATSYFIELRLLMF